MHCLLKSKEHSVYLEGTLILLYVRLYTLYISFLGTLMERTKYI